MFIFQQHVGLSRKSDADDSSISDGNDYSKCKQDFFSIEDDFCSNEDEFVYDEDDFNANEYDLKQISDFAVVKNQFNDAVRENPQIPKSF